MMGIFSLFLRDMFKKACLLWLMITAVHVMAQSVSGEILMRDNSSLYLNQIYVTNVNDQRSVLSDVNGNFTIAAKPGDIIRFTSIVTERKDIKVTDNMLQGKPLLIELKIAYYEIEEIVLNRFKPSGNLKKDVLALKTGEKEMKLKEMIGLPEPKGDGTPPQLPLLGMAGGGISLSVDSFYDLISGEKQKKERLQAYERMSRSISNIKEYFGPQYFADLKIPPHLTDNFLQFVYSSDNLYPYVLAGNYEGTKIYIEKYLPIYQRRLKNSNLMQTTLN